MKLSFIIFSVVAAFTFIEAPAAYNSNKRELSEGWTFRGAREHQALDAKVPGSVHTDLLNHGLIPDPFIRQNERAVQWVDKEDWVYETLFDLTPAELDASNVNLVFKGLDTYADVFLNDSLILSGDNMFVEWNAPVKHLLKDKGNVLKVYFHSPIKTDLPKYDSIPFHYYAGNDHSADGGMFDKQVSIFARKAQYQYGWDWGPRLVTSGIWRPVYLESYSGPVITDLYFRTLDITKKKARMSVDITVNSEEEIKNCLIVISDKADGRKLLSTRADISNGENHIRVEFTVNNPKLWWSNGLGEAHLYNFNVALQHNGQILADANEKTGIRTIELVREEDKEGKSFYFKLNGVPVFAKGANYIPQDNLLTRVNDFQYKKMLEDAAAANMNMLRVWGGGIYENDRFYELADSLGLMVWQDFMFACSLYPGDDNFLRNVKEEATQNVKRLRNHPSVSLWCGNNEILEAWQYWGLRKGYREAGVEDRLWNEYTSLFHDLLPEVVEENAPGSFYVASSPAAELTESRDSKRGDVHMWNVWVWDQPIEVYDSISGRFISEYGFQSYPDYSTIMKYAPDTTSHSVDSNVIRWHQKAGPASFDRMQRYLDDNYPPHGDFKSLVYQSQLLQGDAVKKGIESHRRNKPYTMGSLYWQLNDCWPVMSWSSIDYYGNWKPLHYYAGKAFADILVSPVAENDSVAVYLVSDRMEKVKGILSWDTFSTNGEKIAGATREINILPNGVAKILISKKEMLEGMPENDVIADLKFITGDNEYGNVFLFVKPKDLSLLKPDITLNVTDDNGPKIEVSSSNYVKGLHLMLPGEGDFFDDNYFDLVPGKTYTIGIQTNKNLSEIKNGITWESLFETIEK